jgi:hypothetical protein
MNKHFLTVLRSELPLILGLSAYLAVNFYLWSRPISHEALFFVTLPLGAGFFAWFMWHVSRNS